MQFALSYKNYRSNMSQKVPIAKIYGTTLLHHELKKPQTIVYFIWLFATTVNFLSFQRIYISMKERFLLLLLLVFTIEILSAQNPIGIPEISNSSKLVYGAGAQNWDIKQGADGVMYFANNEGLLSFDGSYWK